MVKNHPISGVIAAALTPLRADDTPEYSAVPMYLDFLARRGCHGALLLGTTGEGPSFSPDERREILISAREVRKIHPDFLILAGTGTPSLDETIQLTRLAFELDLDGAVVLPPYYYKKVSADGLYAWFSAVLHKAVPADGALLLYHIPQVTGIDIPLSLLQRLADDFPQRFAGIKDSSGNAEFVQQLGASLGDRLSILVGNDTLFSTALESGGSGCITAMSNLLSPELRRVWDCFQANQPDREAQERINAARRVADRFPPAPPLYKALVSLKYQLPAWSVRPPLRPLDQASAMQALAELDALLG